MRSVVRVIVCVVGLTLPWIGEPSPSLAAEPVSEPSGDLFSQHIEGASRLEGRLLAPCCWDSSRQTLDIHGSPVANELRREIRTRLLGGEAPDAIEADLVRRYGEKILAVPPGNPLRQMGIVLVVVMAFAGAGAATMLLRWKRRTRAADEETKEATPAKRDEWDERLEAELDELR